MESNNTFTHIVWSVAALAVIAFVLVSGRVVSGQVPTPGQAGSMLSSEASANPVLYSTDVLSLLAQLRSIRLEDNIKVIETEIFKSFDDYTQEVVSEPKGRLNPFELLPGETAESLSNSGTTQAPTR